VILFFGGLSLLVTYTYAVKLSKTEMMKKARLLAYVLCDQLLDMVVVNDAASINTLINHMKHDDREIHYIVVFDNKQSIIGHTFDSDNIPAFLSKYAADTGLSFFVDKKNRVSILQASERFMNGSLGSVVVGIDESVSVRHGKQILSLLAIVLALLLVCVAVSAGFLSYFPLRPIRHIIRQLESYVPGHKVPEFKILFNDEIKLLAIKFREMTERLNAMVAEFQQTQLHMIETEKLASIGTLASGVAHEINNPIAGIEICAHRLQKSPTTLDPKQEEYVKLIIEAAKHIQTIVRSLLAYARQPDQKVEQVDLCSVTRFALKLLNYRLQKKEITLVEKLPEVPCNVWGIHGQLVQIIVNGIINAIDASHNKGKITVGIADANNYFCIGIVDNGVGIDESIIGKVFDPFFTTKGSQGTGLGLYVSYNIVVAHKGTIKISPVKTGGTQLEILLPKAGSEKITIEQLKK
jgi:two-component system NtrC family sensor kinase